MTIDCVVEMFDHGASPEEIAEQYGSVTLPDIYEVLTYYLRNRETVRAHISKQAAESEKARVEADASFPPI